MSDPFTPGRLAGILRRLGVTAILDRLDHLHDHSRRQETTMAKIADELDDIARRQTAIRDALTASTTNTRAALQRLETEVQGLRDGDLTEEQQARVDAIKAAADDLRAAAESADDGYEPPVVEPSPFAPGDDGSVAGSTDANTRDTEDGNSSARASKR